MAHLPSLKVGGTLNPVTDIYIRRPQDEELFRLLRAGEYCNVMSSRQMGKSSAMRRAHHRLVNAGVAVAEIDIAGSLGTSQIDKSQWYCGFLEQVAREFKIKKPVTAWWDENAKKPASQRLQEFFRDIIHSAVPQKKVIFVDEIDAALGLPFTDDFFTAIRGMYNERSRVPAYKNITFCLLGVAQPNELIRGDRMTTYNVGTSIELRDFQTKHDDLSPLVALLSEKRSPGEDLLQTILAWTDGHPFLTTSLCKNCIEDQSCQTPGDVDALIETSYRSIQALRRDSHFVSVIRILDHLGGQDALFLYQRILRGKRESDSVDKVKASLKLSGLVKSDDAGYLKVRNRIYERIFDRDWLDAKLQPLRNRRRLIWGSAAVVFAFVVVSSWFVYDQRIVKSRVREATAQAWIQALDGTPDEDEAAKYYGLLTGQTIDEKSLGHALTGYEQEAAKSYDAFWQRRATRFEWGAWASLIGGHADQALILAAATGVKANRPVSSRFQQIYQARGYERLVTTLRGHEGAVNAAVFSPDGAVIVSAAADGRILLWDARTGRSLDDKASEASGPKGQAIQSLSLVQTPDDVVLVSSTPERHVDLWALRATLEGGARGLVHQGAYEIPVAQDDAPTYATRHREQPWLLTTGRQARTWSPRLAGDIELVAAASQWVSHAAYSPDGRRVVLSTIMGSAEVRRADLRGPVIARMVHPDGVAVVMAGFRPDGEAIVTAAQDGIARLWDVDHDGQHGQPRATLRLVSRSNQLFQFLTSVSFCAGNDRLVAVSGRLDPQLVTSDNPPATQGLIAIWDTYTNTSRLLPSSEPVYHVAFSPDCSLVAASQEDGLVRVWQAGSEIAPADDDDVTPSQRWRVWQTQLGLTAISETQVEPLGAREPVPMQGKLEAMGPENP